MSDFRGNVRSNENKANVEGPKTQEKAVKDLVGAVDAKNESGVAHEKVTDCQNYKWSSFLGIFPHLWLANLMRSLIGTLIR